MATEWQRNAWHAKQTKEMLTFGRMCRIEAFHLLLVVAGSSRESIKNRRRRDSAWTSPSASWWGGLFSKFCLCVLQEPIIYMNQFRKIWVTLTVMTQHFTIMIAIRRDTILFLQNFFPSTICYSFSYRVKNVYVKFLATTFLSIGDHYLPALARSAQTEGKHTAHDVA